MKIEFISNKFDESQDEVYELYKSYLDEKWDKSKLVQKLIKIRRKGKEFYRNQWVRLDYETKEGTLDKDTVNKIFEQASKKWAKIEKKKKWNSEEEKKSEYDKFKVNNILKPVGRIIMDDFEKKVKMSKLPKSEEFDKEKQDIQNEIKEIKEKSKNEGLGYTESVKMLSPIFDKLTDHEKRREEANKATVNYIKNSLSTVRELGSDKALEKRVFSTKKSPALQLMHEALSSLPTDWIKASADKGTVSVRCSTNQRGRYRYSMNAHTGEVDNNGEIIVDKDVATNIHEFTHRIEHSCQDVKDMEKAFFEDRTKGEQAVSLRKLTGLNYGPYEFAKKDNFIEPYMGKDYAEKYKYVGSKMPKGGVSYEISSMGLEYLFTKPEKMLKDKDMSAFLLGLLAVAGKK